MQGIKVPCSAKSRDISRLTRLADAFGAEARAGRKDGGAAASRDPVRSSSALILGRGALAGGRREEGADRGLESGRFERRHTVRQHPRLDRVALPALVMNDGAALGVENEIALDAVERKIAAELAPVLDRRRA